jgi:hypothetical protein
MYCARRVGGDLHVRDVRVRALRQNCLQDCVQSTMWLLSLRKSGHVIFGLICLWLLRYTTTQLHKFQDGTPKPEMMAG